MIDAQPIDAQPIDAQPIDAPPDAACEKTLLIGGTDPATQGWTIYTQSSATISYGADYTQLATVTDEKGNGGQLLLARPNTFAVDEAFKLEVVMQVVANPPHIPDTLDASVAIMGSLTGQVGNQAERSEMVSVLPTTIDWGDDAQKATANVLDGAFHTYVLAVDAARTATLSLDGTVLLTRANFVTNGTIAVGDQTNDANVEATTQIRSVKQLCVD